MKKILVFGAHGQIAQIVTKNLLAEDVTQRLFLQMLARLTVTDAHKENFLKVTLPKLKS